MDVVIARADKLAIEGWREARLALDVTTHHWLSICIMLA
jgi:hypothetical protein